MSKPQSNVAFLRAPDSQNLLSSPRRDMEVFLRPAAVAVVGATETPGSVGRTLLWNLISTPFGGTVFPINPKRTGVLGIQAYPSLSALPVPADLAVIVTPAITVPRVIAECVQTGVKGAIVISAGFREIGPAGRATHRSRYRVHYQESGQGVTSSYAGAKVVRYRSQAIRFQAEMPVSAPSYGNRSIWHDSC